MAEKPAAPKKKRRNTVQRAIAARARHKPPELPAGDPNLPEKRGRGQPPKLIPDARTLEQVPKSVLDGADLVLDGGELPGTPSTVIDLRDYSAHRRWHVLREGALARSAVRESLTSLA